MMRLIRQLFGKSRRDAQADAMIDEMKKKFDKEERDLRAKRIVVERLVAQLGKDVTAWH